MILGLKGYLDNVMVCCNVNGFSVSEVTRIKDRISQHDFRPLID